VAATFTDWQEQWRGALEGAKAGIAAYETRCRTEGVTDEASKAAADAELAMSIVQCALLRGLPWTDHDGGSTTVERARHVLAIASQALDILEAQHKARN
jgi:hypothetical protein